MFSRMVVEKSSVSCSTMEICSRSEFLVIAAQVLPIEQEPAGGRIVKARHQRKQRALSGAGAADEGHRLARLDVEIDIVQDEPRRFVAEGHILKHDLARGRAEPFRIRGVVHLVLLVEHLEAALRAGRGAFQRPGRVGERLERRVEHEEVSCEMRISAPSVSCP